MDDEVMEEVDDLRGQIRELRAMLKEERAAREGMEEREREREEKEEEKRRERRKKIGNVECTIQSNVYSTCPLQFAGIIYTAGYAGRGRSADSVTVGDTKEDVVSHLLSLQQIFLLASLGGGGLKICLKPTTLSHVFIP